MPDYQCDVDGAGQKISYCPFGCKPQDTDEWGYCDHLVGFSNADKFYEPVAPLIRKKANGETFDTGFKTVQLVGKQAVMPGDIRVNPERLQKMPDGTEHMMKRWVSERIYRAREGDKVKLDGKTVEPDRPAPENHTVTAMFEELKEMMFNQSRQLQALSTRVGDLENAQTEPAKEKPELAEV